MQAIKEVIALHYARSIETLETVERMFGSMMEKNRAAMLRQPDLLDRLYEAKTGDAAGLRDDPAREAFADGFLGRLWWLSNSGTYFRFRVIYLYQASLDWIAPLKVQVLRAPSGSEFLISDAPSLRPTQAAIAAACATTFGSAAPTALSCLSRHASPSRSTTSLVTSLSMPLTF